MKLKVMNCRNCNAPLQLQDGKLVCAFCGGVFEIEKDASDVEYEKYANAEKYILQSLTNQKAQLEEYYRQQELEKIRQEEEREQRQKMERKERARKARRKTFVQLIICAILIGVIVYTLKFLVERAKEMKADQQAANAAALAEKGRPDSYRITDTLLKKDPETMEKIWQLAVDYERNEQHEGAVIESSEDIWNMKSDPELLEQYLFTTERHSGVYMLLKVTLETDDGRSKELYDCVVVRDLVYDRNGDIVIPDDVWVSSAQASDYDYFWRGSFDEELVRSEIFESKKMNYEDKYYFFEL